MKRLLCALRGHRTSWIRPIEPAVIRTNDLYGEWLANAEGGCWCGKRRFFEGGPVSRESA